MMEEEFVRRRKWITHEQFLDRLATANLIPGPSSTEVAIFVGQLKRGWRGLIVAGACFIIPAALIVSVIAWAYVRFGSLPQAQRVLYAIKPAVVAVVIQALGKLSRTGIRTALLAVIAAFAAFLTVIGISPVLVLLLAGALSAATLAMKGRLLGLGTLAGTFSGTLSGTFPRNLTAPRILVAAAAVVTASVAWPVGLWRLFLSFLKIGSVVFGSGYVLLAFLQAEFVERLHWLTDKQLVDAVAVGQFTPGSAVHDGDLYWLRGCGMARRNRGDDRNLSAGLFSGGDQRTGYSVAAAVSSVCGSSRWSGCGLARSDGGRDLATGQGIDRGLGYARDLWREPDYAHQVSH